MWQAEVKIPCFCRNFPTFLQVAGVDCASVRVWNNANSVGYLGDGAIDGVSVVLRR